jgi:hypothetical protein
LLLLQVLLAAAESIATYATDDPTPHSRAQVLLQQLDAWAQQHPQPAAEEAALLKALQGIPWCPVLVRPPNAALPWPHHQPAAASAASVSVGSSASEQAQAADGTLHADDSTVVAPASPASQQQQQQQPVLRIAPKLVAPAELAWLTSAPLRLLAAHLPSQQLQQLMGWSVRQVLRSSVAIAQLMELGKMYSAGQVRRCAWQTTYTAASHAMAAYAAAAARLLFCCNCRPGETLCLVDLPDIAPCDVAAAARLLFCCDCAACVAGEDVPCRPGEALCLVDDIHRSLLCCGSCAFVNLQLMELGKMYPAGQVRHRACSLLCCGCSQTVVFQTCLR